MWYFGAKVSMTSNRNLVRQCERTVLSKVW